MTSAGPLAAIAGRTAEAATRPPTMLTNAPRLTRIAERSASRYGGRQSQEPAFACFIAVPYWAGGRWAPVLSRCDPIYCCIAANVYACVHFGCSNITPCLRGQKLV